jgi:hypothetical protein
MIYLAYTNQPTIENQFHLIQIIEMINFLSTSERLEIYYLTLLLFIQC